MFNEITLNDIETIDKVVSERNKILYKKGVFLSWTFPKNHRHEHEMKSLSSNYFCIWGGSIDDVNLELLFFAGVWLLPEVLNQTTDEEILDLLKKN